VRWSSGWSEVFSLRVSSVMGASLGRGRRSSHWGSPSVIPD
jgi:hypothetical protein